ncbi:hypothetical protein HY492_03035 [Candidatus Woesearchaeota archaeon]|nr:hypothetical protein [Candidatus Woesearchaeota archaeon]
MNLQNIITWVLHGLLIALLGIALWNGEYLRAIVAAIAIILAFLPAIAQRNWRITVPWGFEVLLIIALSLHVSGVIFRWYELFAWWDTMTHLIGSATVAILAFMGVYALYVAGKIHVSIKMIGLFTFFTAMAVGGLWEVLEFGLDYAFDSRSQVDNADTNTDLINDGIAGLLVAIAGMEYLKRAPEARLENRAQKLMKQLKKFLK